MKCIFGKLSTFHPDVLHFLDICGKAPVVTSLTTHLQLEGEFFEHPILATATDAKKVTPNRVRSSGSDMGYGMFRESGNNRKVTHATSHILRTEAKIARSTARSAEEPGREPNPDGRGPGANEILSFRVTALSQPNTEFGRNSLNRPIGFLENNALSDKARLKEEPPPSPPEPSILYVKRAQFFATTPSEIRPAESKARTSGRRRRAAHAPYTAWRREGQPG